MLFLNLTSCFMLVFMGQYIQNNLYFSDRTLAVFGEKSCVVLEPGYDGVVQGKYAGSSAEEIILLAQSLNKKISHIWFSHYHGDHVGNMPFYLKRIEEPQLIGSAHSPLIEQYTKINLVSSTRFILISTPTTLIIDGREYMFLPTPGHSFFEDDLSVYMPQEKILLVGDLLQPQGSRYDFADGFSPVPFFFHGEQYLNSLKLLRQLAFCKIITGHSQILDEDTAKIWLDVTITSVQRIRELAQQAFQQQSQQITELLCEQIYDQIVAERHFDIHRAQSRKINKGSNRKSDYEVYDLPGIRDFVKYAQNCCTNT